MPPGFLDANATPGGAHPHAQGASTGLAGDAWGATTRNLLMRMREGDLQALDGLFSRLTPFLRRWARGRLPRWARSGGDTSDLVQDALVSTLQRIDVFEPRRKHALRAYLQQAIRNRIRDAVRHCSRHATVRIEDLELEGQAPLVEASGQESAFYRRALERLTPEERDLIVGRIELGYSYEQLALTTGRPTPDAARMAVKRSLLRLAEEMACA